MEVAPYDYEHIKDRKDHYEKKFHEYAAFFFFNLTQNIFIENLFFCEIILNLVDFKHNGYI